MYRSLLKYKQLLLNNSLCIYQKSLSQTETFVNLLIWMKSSAVYELIGSHSYDWLKIGVGPWK